MASLSDLLKLTTLTQGEAQVISLNLLRDALKKVDWSLMNGNLLEPFQAGYDNLPEGMEGYKLLLTVASDKIVEQNRVIKEMLKKDAVKPHRLGVSVKQIPKEDQKKLSDEETKSPLFDLIGGLVKKPNEVAKIVVKTEVAESSSDDLHDQLRDIGEIMFKEHPMVAAALMGMFLENPEMQEVAKKVIAKVQKKN